MVRGWMALLLVIASWGRAERGGDLAGRPHFTDVTEEAGISFRHVHGGTGKRILLRRWGPGSRS